MTFTLACITHSNFILFRVSVLLHSHSWPGTHCVDETALEVTKFHLPLPPKHLG